MTYYDYKVRVYDYEDFGKQNIHCGIVCAEDYGDAANKVVEYYGSKYVIDIKVSEWDTDSCVLETSPEVLTTLIHDEGGYIPYEGDDK